MAQLNKFQGIGNLGKEPELNVTPDGVPFCKFTVALNSGYGDKKSTLWMNLVTWRNIAEVVQTHCHKGTPVYFEGRITKRPYTDKNGVDRDWWEVNVSELQILKFSGGGEPPQEGDEFP